MPRALAADAAAPAIDNDVMGRMMRLAVLAAVLSFAVCAGAFAAEVEIAFMHDIHSHLDPFKAYAPDGGFSMMGGVSGIKAVVDGFRRDNPDILVIDGGDFSMGSMYQLGFEDLACEIRALNAIGVEFTTFGNHEFDFGDSALAKSFGTAVREDGRAPRIPRILSCNSDLSRSAFPRNLVKEYDVIERGGVRIALFGLTGRDAAIYSGASDIAFGDCVEAARRIVAEIREKENPDFIAVLSHSGTNADKSRSEDEILASSVGGIDFILSGHTHTALEYPVFAGDTVIGGCGEYGEFVGRVRFSGSREEGWKLDSYEIIPIDGNVARDTGTEAMLSGFRREIGERYLASEGLGFDQVLARNEAVFPPFASIYGGIAENAIGDFLSDSFVYSYRKHFGDLDGLVAAVPSGLIRDTFYKGDVTAADCFAAYGLGRGSDGSGGYPLCFFYLTGRELKRAAEVSVHFSGMMPSANLHFSGLDFIVNGRRLPFNKVAACFAHSTGEGRKDIDDGALYPVITDSYTMRMMGSIGRLSKGLYSFTAKDVSGKPVSGDCVLRKPDGKELKAWVAVTEYAASFPKGEDGVSVIPETESAPKGRREIYSSFRYFLGNPNRFAFAEMAAAALCAAILAAVARLVLKVIRRGTEKE